MSVNRIDFLLLKTRYLLDYPQSSDNFSFFMILSISKGHIMSFPSCTMYTEKHSFFTLVACVSLSLLRDLDAQLPRFVSLSYMQTLSQILLL